MRVNLVFSVVLTGPQRGNYIEFNFLDCAVSRVPRAWKTKPHATESRPSVARTPRSRKQTKIALEIRRAVISLEHIALASLPFQTGEDGTRFHCGKISFRLHDCVGP